MHVQWFTMSSNELSIESLQVYMRFIGLYLGLSSDMQFKRRI
jgi:hypothetical protein